MSDLSTAMKESLNSCVKDFGNVVKGEVNAWQKDASRTLNNTAELTELVLGQCILDAEQKFRQDLMQKMGEKGAACFGKIIEECCADIVKYFKDSVAQKDNAGAKKDFPVTSLGILPLGTRASWHTKVNGHAYDLFCVEQEPCRRTIRFGGKFTAFAFPWIRFFILFRDGVLCPYGGWYYFFVFYGKNRITDDKSPLFFPHLTHVNDTYPHPFCIGHGLPAIKLNDSSWHAMIENYFWSGDFSAGGWTIYYNSCVSVPELGTPEKWAELSEKNPEKVIGLSYIPLNKNVGEIAQDILQSALNYLEGGCAAKAAEEKLALTKAERDKLLLKFRERLEESLHFLGVRFAVDPDLKKSAAKNLDDHFEQAKLEIIKLLDARIAKLTI